MMLACFPLFLKCQSSVGLSLRSKCEASRTGDSAPYYWQCGGSDTQLEATVVISMWSLEMCALSLTRHPLPQRQMCPLCTLDADQGIA